MPLYQLATAEAADDGAVVLVPAEDERSSSAPHQGREGALRPTIDEFVRIALWAADAGFRVTDVSLRDRGWGPSTQAREDHEEALLEAFASADARSVWQVLEGAGEFYVVSAVELSERQSRLRVRVSRNGTVNASGKSPMLQKALEALARLIEHAVLRERPVPGAGA